MGERKRKIDNMISIFGLDRVTSTDMDNIEETVSEYVDTVIDVSIYDIVMTTRKNELKNLIWIYKTPISMDMDTIRYVVIHTLRDMVIEYISKYIHSNNNHKKIKKSDLYQLILLSELKWVEPSLDMKYNTFEKDPNVRILKKSKSLIKDAILYRV